MNLETLAKQFFSIIDRGVGPFDRPFQFRPFPFDAGGALNFLTVGLGREKFVTYVSWDLLGHEQQKRGKLGRYELLAHCDDEQWCLNILTNIGRQSLVDVFEPGDTMDISPWIKNTSWTTYGIIFEEAFSIQIKIGLKNEQCGLLRCIGITKDEFEFARLHGIDVLIALLKDSGIYPKTILNRASIELRVS